MQNCWCLGHCLSDTVLVIVHPLRCVIVKLTLKKQVVWLLPMKKSKLWKTQCYWDNGWLSRIRTHLPYWNCTMLFLHTRPWAPLETWRCLSEWPSLRSSCLQQTKVFLFTQVLTWLSSGTVPVKVGWTVEEGSEVIMPMILVNSHSHLLPPYQLSPQKSWYGQFFTFDFVSMSCNLFLSVMFGLQIWALGWRQQEMESVTSSQTGLCSNPGFTSVHLVAFVQVSSPSQSTHLWHGDNTLLIRLLYVVMLAVVFPYSKY